ncbi:LPXTG cell wall anchor domain-containing protein [Kitasatospora sp. LaBMicrA B282]|uniref:DUF7927 domain-containing protein n=1 Tax=Kitasatospora sp. LaBMicrA B282 TaxID=3420949 RepID=UPI003D12C724
MAPVRSLLGGRVSAAMRGVLALLCLVPQGGLALAAAPPAYAPQALPEQHRAQVACTPTGSFTNCARFTYSGGDQTFTVPPGVSNVFARLWGAGGGGSPSAYYTGQFGGGGGGYTTGTLAVMPGQTLTVTSGQGGLMNSTSSTYGGGGAGGAGVTTSNGSSATGASGGGLSAVWNGNYGTTPLLIAGGAGGSSPGGDTLSPAGGGGGGTNGGQDNNPSISGRGGTQTAGGPGSTDARCGAGRAGSQYQGGAGAGSTGFEGGGGGGGGYYGGGGGSCQRNGFPEPNGMGGGGSGYIGGTGVTNAQTTAGANSSANGRGGNAAGQSDPLYTSGIGNGGGYTNGNNGEVTLEWVTQTGLSIKKTAAPATYVPGSTLSYTIVVSNAGPAPATGAAVRDALPSPLSAFTWTCAAGSTSSSCGAASGTGNLNTTATIAANDNVTYTVTGTVPSGTIGTLSNTATVTRPANTTDPNCGPTCSSTVNTPGQVTTGLSVTKTPDKNPYVPGQPLTYTIVVKNNGPSDAIGASVQDTLPAAVQGFTWSCTASTGSSCGSTATGTGNINTTVNVLAGGQLTYTLTGTVPSDASGSLDNRATVTPPSGASDPICSPNCTSTANPIPPGNQANLVVSKTLLTNPVVPGQQIQWQVNVTNNGPSTARSVVVTDPVPAGVTNPTMTAANGTACPITGGTATCPAVDILVNGSATWTLTGTLDPNATSTPVNTATVTGGPDPSASAGRTAVATPTPTPAPQANLTVSKTLLTNPVVPGQQIQWQVKVTNNGPSRARNVVVTDTIPAGVTAATMNADANGTACPIAGGTATCPAVEIPAGSSATWTVSGALDPNATATPTNNVTVTGGPDPSASVRTAVATPTSSPTPQANLTVSKVLLTDPVVPGQQIQWRVTVTNNGPSRARNVVVTDPVPTGVTAATMKSDADGTACPITAGTATCPALDIPVGSSASWTLSGSLDPNATTTPTNTATVTGGPDPSASVRTAVASPTSSPQPQASLTVTKTLLTDPVIPGRQIQWRVIVFNAGPSRARNVVVADTVPAGVSNPSMTAQDGTVCPITAGIATCPAVEIPAGRNASWTLTGTLDPNATTTPTNSVTVTGGPDPSASAGRTAVATPTNSPAPQANLTVAKVLLTNPVVPGQQIQWQVNVTNNGPSRARNVIVTDTIPAGVNSPTMTAADGTSCPITGTTATCPTVEIPAGSTATWTVSGTLDPNATSTPTNTVTVTGGPDPSASARTAVATPTSSPTPQASLTVAKVLLTNPVIPGQQIQWQVNVTNNGPSRARNVIVTDTIPAGVTNPTMTAADGTTCPITNGIATCPTIEIPAGQTLTWTVTGTLGPNATTTPTNTVTVTGGPDPSASAHTAVATPTSSPIPQAGLTVTKTLLTNPVVPGQQIQWRVTVTNNGPSRARNVVVTDTIPGGVTNPTMTAADGTACPIANGTATCPAVEIPAGSAATWTVSGTLDPNATTTPTNNVTVTGGPDPSTTAHTAVASPTNSPTPQASLSISKVLLTNPVVPGQQIQWQVTVTNNGPSRARNVIVTDTIPAGVTNPTMTAADGTTCPITNNTATCPAVEIPAGSSTTWTVTGTLDPNATTTPTNTATVTGGPDPSTSAHTAIASPTNSPTPQANLTIAKTLLTNPVIPGQQIQWQVSVTNNGPSRARNVIVTDTIPAGVTNPTMTASDGTACPITTDTATCPEVEVPAGQTLTWTLTATLDPNATTTPTNTATVTGGPDPSASAHTAVASPTNSPTSQANLTVSKVLLTDPVIPGQQIQWRVTVTNNGPSRARNVVVTDPIPDGVSNVSMTSDADGTLCPITNRVAQCPAVDVPAGQSASWTYTGTLSSAATTTPVNTATVTGGPDPSTSVHTAVATPTSSPVPQANLTISKVLLTNPVVAGQAIAWRVTVTNNGPSLARNVVVTDQLPDTLRAAKMSADDSGEACTVTGTTAVCPTTTIAQGDSKSYTVSGVLSSEATAVPTNTATVTGGPDPSTSARTAVASPTVPIGYRANLTVTKILLTDPVVPGQQISWRIAVTNNGPSRARNVVVTDHIPPDTTNIAMVSDTDGTPCPATGSDLVCPAVEIPAGQTLSWTVTGTLSPDAQQTPVNTATVTGGDPSASPVQVSAQASVPPVGKAEVTIAKSLVTDPVIPGQQISWRITVTNNGPSTARGIDLKDQVPDSVTGATIASDAAGVPCRITGGVAECFPFDLAVGATDTFTLSGTLAQNATVTPTNTAVLVNNDDPSQQTRTAVAQGTATPSPQANLTISKTLLTDPVVPGQRIQWQVTVTNNGPSRARNVVVSDQVPAQVQNPFMVSTSDGTACPIAGGTASCPAVELPVGGSISYTLGGTLDPNATTTPTNTATVTGGPDPSASVRTAVATPTSSPVPQAALTVAKTLLTNPVIPGQQIQWQVSVTNNGPSRARNVIVTDTIPTGVNNPSMTAADGTNCPITGNTATCPAVEIPAGSSTIWTLTATLDPNATTTPTNTATVTGGPDPSTSAHTAVASPTNSPSPQAGLSISKVLLTNPVVPGQQIQWQVTVTNNGPSRARNVIVTDPIPTGVNNPSMTAADGTNCPITGNTATCPAIEIPTGQTATWTVTGTLDPNATTTPTNTATVTGGPDPSASAHTAVASPTGSPVLQANLTVAKTLLTNPVIPGQQIQWQVTVTNNGPGRARNVIVTDQVPAGVTAPTMTAADGTNCPITGSTTTCPAVEIPAGQTAIWTLTGTLDPNATTTPTNTATVTGGPDPSTSVHTAVASPTNSPMPQAGLTVAKTLLTDPVIPGQQIQWQVTVTNNGPSRARNVIVTDQIPSGVNNPIMTAADGTNCPITGNTATCPAIEIPAGQTATWTVTGTLDPNATTTPTNTVTVTGGPDPSASVHTAVASPTSSPTPQAGLTVAKVLLTNPVTPGQQIQWQVSVTNNGPSRARNVIVTDTIPTGVNNPSMTAADGTNCPITGSTATCPAIEIPTGQTAIWTLTGTLDPNATTTPTNTATVTGGPDPSASAHTAIASPASSPTSQANLTVAKVLLTNPVVPGQQIQWQVTVTNNGPSRARNVIVTDTIPTGVNNPSMTAADGTNCPITNGTATCPAIEIPAGQTATWTVTGTLDPNATTTPTNTATVTGGPDPSASVRTAAASPTSSPVPQAALTVAKTLLTNPVIPGQQIQWQVSVTNNGPSRARNVVVTDTIPTGVNNPSMTAADGTNCPITGNTATCPAIEIPAGQTATWTVTGTLDPNATTTPTNTATVTGGPDPSASVRTAAASPTSSPVPQAALTVAKTLLTNPVIPGQQIQWQVSVTNNGPSRARNVVVTDTIPTGVNNPSMTAADGTTCPITNGTATCPAIEIPAGQTATWTVTGTLDPNATTTPTNTATVTGGPDPSASVHTAVASPTSSPTPQAGLTVSKVLLTSPVVPGQQIQWQVTVTNNGPSRARNVVVTDTIPAGVNNPTMTSADGTTCPITNGTATCPAIEIPAGQTATWTVTGTLDPNATTTPTNTATVTGGPDPSASVHTAVASPTSSPTPQAGLTVAKVLLTDPVIPGQQIQWQVTVTNNGPSRARNVVVSDQIPAGVNNPTMTAADGTTCPITNGTATCPAVEIPAGQTATWTVTGTLDPNATTTPTNDVTVTGGPDPSTSAHTAIASPTNSPTPQANLTIAKTLLTNPVTPGQQIQWQVTVTNNGPSRARNVIVTDQIPTGVNNPTMTSADGTTCPITNGTATCPAIEIPAGQTATWTLTGTLDPNATTTPTNTATVTGGPDPSTSAHTAIASPTSSPTPQAGLSISKVLLTNPVTPGQQIQWQVTVTNNGPSRARNVIVTDTIPTTVTNPTMTAPDGTTCPITNGTATCPAIEIPTGQTATWTVTGTLDPNATTTPTNIATVTGGPDPSASAHTATAQASASTQSKASLTVSKVLLTDPVVPGQPISWRISVTNNGPSRARNVVVTDPIPTTVTNPTMTAPDGSTCPITNNTATCPPIEIATGDTVTFTLTGTLAPDATAVPGNTAVVTGGPDPSVSAHTAVASPTNSPTPQANLTLAKVLVTDPVIPGQQIQWRITVTNNGPSRARNVIVTDPIPTTVTNPTMTADADGTTCPITNNTASCPAIELAAGQSYGYTVTGTLDPNATTTPTNTATVTGGPDPSTSAHTAVATPTNSPAPQANLTVSKVLLTNPVVPGQQIQWRITVTNNGPSRARDVIVTDPIPTGVTNPTMTAPDGTACPITSDTATCPAFEVPAGETLAWTLTGTLDPAATLTPTNTATVTGGPDPSTSAHTAVATPTAPPERQANLGISKVLLTSPVVAGQPIAWRVNVTNYGPSLARDVVVTDQVPAGVDNPAMTADADGTSCPIADGLATCPAIELAPGRTASWTLSGTLDPNATEVPTNTAVVTGGPDPSASAHTAVATPTEPITVRHDLRVAKQAAPADPKPGDKVTYTVTATNLATGTYHGAVITDDLSGVLDAAGYNDDATATAGLASYTAPRLTWTLDLQPGATQTLTYTVTVKPDAGGRTLTNLVTADGSNCTGQATGAGDPCTTTTNVTPTPVTPTPSPSRSGGPLPKTGSPNTALATLIAAVLLAAGAGLVVLRRSRR